MLKRKLSPKFLQSILCLSTLFLQTDSLAQSSVRLNPHEKLIVLSFDGFRYDYFTKAHTPNMDLLRASGAFSRYMNPQFMTKTFPNHQSIVTGLYTESHGIVDKAAFDPKYGKVVSGTESGDMGGYFWNYFPENVAPVWIWNEWAGGISGAVWPGSETPYGKNLTLPTYSLTYNKSRSFETRVDYVVNWLTNEDKPANLVFMYFDEPDGQGHKFGPNSPEVSKAVERMDNVTGYLVDQLVSKGILEETNIILLSDHGFEEASLRRVINISRIVDPMLYTVYGKTPVLNILPNEDKLDLVYNSFKLASESGHFSIYRKNETPEAWHYSNNRRIMPLIIVADPGYIFDEFVVRLKNKLNNTEELDKNSVFGVHGYDSRSENMRAFFIANGPAIKKVEIMPFDNVDIFPLICEMMRIPIPPNNGSLDIIRGILKNNDSGSLRSSPNLGIILQPIDVFIVLIPMVSLVLNKYIVYLFSQ